MPEHAIDPNLAAEQVRQLPGDRQPETGAMMLARGRLVDLTELLKNDLLIFRALCRARYHAPRAVRADHRPARLQARRAHPRA